MKRSSLVAGLVLGAAAWATPTWFAQATPAAALHATNYKIDGGHSSVLFRVQHLKAANFYGRFNDVSGQFVIDDHNPAASSFEVTVRTESIDSNSGDRDKHLKSEEFFNVGQYPEMTFKSTSVTWDASDNAWDVKGELTLLGKSQPIEVEVAKVGEGKDPWGGYRFGVETSFTVKRSDYGMTAMVGPLGDDVKLIVSLEGIRQ